MRWPLTILLFEDLLHVLLVFHESRLVLLLKLFWRFCVVCLFKLLLKEGSATLLYLLEKSWTCGSAYYLTSWCWFEGICNFNLLIPIYAGCHNTNTLSFTQNFCVSHSILRRLLRPERIKDAGVSVRKRAIKIIRDVCTSNPKFSEFPSACIVIISRVSDEESSVQVVLEQRNLYIMYYIVQALLFQHASTYVC